MGNLPLTILAFAPSHIHTLAKNFLNHLKNQLFFSRVGYSCIEYILQGICPIIRGLPRSYQFNFGKKGKNSGTGFVFVAAVNKPVF